MTTKTATSLSNSARIRKNLRLTWLYLRSSPIFFADLVGTFILFGALVFGAPALFITLLGHAIFWTWCAETFRTRKRFVEIMRDGEPIRWSFSRRQVAVGAVLALVIVVIGLGIIGTVVGD